MDLGSLFSGLGSPSGGPVGPAARGGAARNNTWLIILVAVLIILGFGRGVFGFGSYGFTSYGYPLFYKKGDHKHHGNVDILYKPFGIYISPIILILIALGVILLLPRRRPAAMVPQM